MIFLEGCPIKPSKEEFQTLRQAAHRDIRRTLYLYNNHRWRHFLVNRRESIVELVRKRIACDRILRECGPRDAHGKNRRKNPNFHIGRNYDPKIDFQLARHWEKSVASTKVVWFICPKEYSSNHEPKKWGRNQEKIGVQIA